MKSYLLYIGLLFVATPALAVNPSAEEIARLRGIVEANFAAQTEEDVKGVLATISTAIPPAERAELARELQACFDETDLQLKLVSFTIINYQHPTLSATGKPRVGPAARAEAQVVQLTTQRGYSHHDLAEHPAELSTYYRHNSAILPQTELVKYTLKFHYDGRSGWKALKIIDRVKPVGRWPGNLDEVMRPDWKPAAECATGNCRFFEKR